MRDGLAGVDAAGANSPPMAGGHASAETGVTWPTGRSRGTRKAVRATLSCSAVSSAFRSRPVLHNSPICWPLAAVGSGVWRGVCAGA